MNKILFVGNGDDTKGSSQCLIELVSILKEQYNYEIIVINPTKNNLNQKCDELGIENYSLGFKEMICKRKGNFFIFSIKFLIKYVMYKFNNFFALRKAVKLNLSDVDLVHSNTTAVDFGAVLANKINKPHIWHLREFGKEDFNFYYFHKNLCQYINDHSDKIISISDVISDKWIEKGLDKDKLIRLYDGVVGKSYSERANFETKIPLKMVFCGGINPDKGQYLLIEAMGKVDKSMTNKMCVDFYGNGEEKYLDKLRERAKELGISNNIGFKGYSTNISSLLKNYDVGVVASRSEGFGRVTVEYLLSGLCVVASNSGANPELLSNGEYGILFNNQDTDDLKDKLEYMIMNPDIVTQYKKKDREFIINNYTLEKNIQNFVDVYEKLRR